MPEHADSPRPHHYEVAHRILPSLMLDPRSDLAQAQATGRLEPALRAVWQEAGRRHRQSDRVDPEGLRCELVEMDSGVGVLVVLPQALRTAEAIAVLVSPLDPATARRYFTLEYSIDLAGTPCAVLGEWSAEGHRNYGDVAGSPDVDPAGPAELLREFVARVHATLAEPPD